MKYGSSFKTSSLEINPYSQHIFIVHPPTLLADPCKDKDAHNHYKSNIPVCNHLVPTIYSLVSQSLFAQNFFNFNEIEYSANIKFRNLKLVTENHHGIHFSYRYYVNNTIPLYSDRLNNQCGKVSTMYFRNAFTVPTPISVRFDYHPETRELLDITGKLKIVKTKFNFNNVTYSLTGSWEQSLLDDLEEYFKQPPKRYTKKYKFTYWFIIMKVREHYKTFRVAFRRSRLPMHYECNIESENMEDGSQFIECFDLLSKYYRKQFELRNHIIEPIYHIDVEQLNYTPAQQKMYKTMYLLEDPNDEHFMSVEQKHLKKLANPINPLNTSTSDNTVGHCKSPKKRNSTDAALDSDDENAISSTSIANENVTNDTTLPKKRSKILETASSTTTSTTAGADVDNVTTMTSTSTTDTSETLNENLDNNTENTADTTNTNNDDKNTNANETTTTTVNNDDKNANDGDNEDNADDDDDDDDDVEDEEKSNLPKKVLLHPKNAKNTSASPLVVISKDCGIAIYPNNPDMYESIDDDSIEEVLYGINQNVKPFVKFVSILSLKNILPRLFHFATYSTMHAEQEPEYTDGESTDYFFYDNE